MSLNWVILGWITSLINLLEQSTEQCGNSILLLLNFTWNQFQRILNLKNYFYDFFEALNCGIGEIFAIYQGFNFLRLRFKLLKVVLLEFLNVSKIDFT